MLNDNILDIDIEDQKSNTLTRYGLETPYDM